MKDLSKIWAKQASLTEWLRTIDHEEADAIQKEDNEKRERLRVLNKTIGLPFDEPVQFSASQVSSEDEDFKMFLKARGNELCAIRLIPLDSQLPKLRMRGKTVKDAYGWFTEQEIDITKYRVDFVPHAEESLWSTIFVVNKHQIFGEVIRGGHHQLTQGMHNESHSPLSFSFDYSSWQIEGDNQQALAHVKEVAEYLRVDDFEKQADLKRELGAEFSHNYLCGYFETVDSEENGVWFIDYNRILIETFEDESLSVPKSGQPALLTGRVGCKGLAEGVARIVDPEHIDSAPFNEGDVLVCVFTSPDYLPLMKKAAAIVTEQGGILSHAAIVSRELDIPCIVGVKNAVSQVKDGKKVIVDANQGTVSIK